MVISGGGPSGCATALFLWAAFRERSWCPRILVIDKAVFPREKICAGAIAGRAERALQAIGVQVRCPSAPIRGLGVVTGEGRLLERHPHPIGRVVRRHEFDTALLAEVVARGIEVRTGVAFEGFRRVPDGLVLATSAGTLTAKCLVGADGVGSRVRRELKLGRGALYAQAVEVDTPWCDADRTDMGGDDVLWFDLRDRRYPGYGWSFPTLVGGESMACRGIYRVTHGVAALRDEAPEVATLLGNELLRLGFCDRRAGALDGLEASGNPSIAPQLKRFAERGLHPHEPTATNRVVLVGEAAGIDPVLGEGIAQAILYGKVAGAFLAACIEKNEWTFSAWPRTFGRSRVGIDLAARRLALPFVYGAGRPWLERCVTESRALARAGLHYFAGERVPRMELLRAAGDALRAAVSPS